MSDQNPFIEQILQSPDSDAPRLMYADWLEERGDPLGEFIRLQCAIAGMGAFDTQKTALKQRCDELRAIHLPVWAAGLDRFKSVVPFFFRGFVEEILIDAEEFLQDPDSLWEAAPTLQGAHLQNARRFIYPLADCPALGRLRRIYLGSQNLDSRDLSTLFRSPFLERTGHLDLSHNPHGNEAMKAFVSPVSLKNLRKLDLWNNHLRSIGLSILARCPSLSRVEYLRLRGNRISGEGLESLAESEDLCNITALDLGENGLSAHSFAPFAEAKSLEALRELDLSENPLKMEGLATLLSFPHLQRLEHLNLKSNGLGDRGVRSLVQSPQVKSLKTLGLAMNHITDEGVQAVADSPNLGNLVALDLSHNWVSPTIRERLLNSKNLPNLRHVEWRELPT